MGHKITEEHVIMALGGTSADIDRLKDQLYQLAHDEEFTKAFAECLTIFSSPQLSVAMEKLYK